MNTTAEGNAFRDRVCDLLRTKYPDATTETKVAWKNADITYTQMDHGSRIRVAVECKKYSKKLNTADLNKIVGDYSAALGNHEIHKLIIVSVHGLEAASRQLISTNPLLRFQTFSQLEESLVGLRPYVEDLALQFEDDEVHAYYIEGRFSGSAGTALEALSKWIADDEGTGFAVLGGYGLGKSSLAKRLASEQAKRYLQDQSERIPILLRLGHVVHETELAGLFGKEFNDQFHLPEFSFRTLLHLNQAGRILIILDGFDEMKHAMTEADFKANFREFNKLRLARKSKVLLLGRPNALSSESYDLLVKGLGRMADQSYVDTDFPAWHEETLDFFTNAESREFLTRYLTYSRNRRGDDMNSVAVEARVDRILADIHDDLMQRPVQARIVGQLAADKNYNFAKINLFKLYADFIDKMIDREQEKPARKKIPHHARITFLRDLAWWAWTRDNSAQGVFRKDEVPLSLLEHLPSGDAIDMAAKKSEYLISSLTEQKDADVLYFAHRSFQEFLVSSWMVEAKIDEPSTLSKISAALTPDIVDFLKKSPSHHHLLKWFELLNGRTLVSLDFLRLLRLNEEVKHSIKKLKPQQLNVHHVAIFCYENLREVEGNSRQEIHSFLYLAIKEAPIKTADFAFLCLLLDAKNLQYQDLICHALAVAWERQMVGAQDVDPNKAALLIDHQHFGVIGTTIRSCLKKRRNMDRRLLTWQEDKAIDQLWEAFKGLGFNSLQGLDLPSDIDATNASDAETLESGDKVRSIESHVFENFLSQGARDQFIKKIYPMRSDEFGLVSKTIR
jgi:hypothetical protein